MRSNSESILCSRRPFGSGFRTKRGRRSLNTWKTRKQAQNSEGVKEFQTFYVQIYGGRGDRLNTLSPICSSPRHTRHHKRMLSLRRICSVLLVCNMQRSPHRSFVTAYLDRMIPELHAHKVLWFARTDPLQTIACLILQTEKYHQGPRWTFHIEPGSQHNVWIDTRQFSANTSAFAWYGLHVW